MHLPTCLLGYLPTSYYLPTYLPPTTCLLTYLPSTYPATTYLPTRPLTYLHTSLPPSRCRVILRVAAGVDQVLRRLLYGRRRGEQLARLTSQGEEQMRWLNATLEESAADWLLVAGHYPVGDRGLSGRYRNWLGR